MIYPNLLLSLLKSSIFAVLVYTLKKKINLI